MSLRFSPEEARARGWIADEPLSPRRRAPRQERASRRDWEYEEQVALLDQFALLYPDLAEHLIGIPNGGSRKHRFEGYRLKRAGARAGVSDLQLCLPRHGWPGLWMEMKATPPHHAAVTTDQWRWLQRMRGVGYLAAVAYGATDGMAVLTSYLDGTLAPPCAEHIAVAKGGGLSWRRPPARVSALAG